MGHCYQEIVDGYQGIFAQLRKAPKDIEEVATMRELGNLRTSLVLHWDRWVDGVGRLEFIDITYDS